MSKSKTVQSIVDTFFLEDKDEQLSVISRSSLFNLIEEGYKAGKEETKKRNRQKAPASVPRTREEVRNRISKAMAERGGPEDE